nr:ribonuclease H-like domain-containing protein [Tanacetum cinerariifolium]
MCNKKNSVLFTDTEYLVLSPNFKLPNASQALLRVPRENNMYNVKLKNIVPSGDLTCLFSKATIEESNLWHRRMGHINFKTINKLVKGNLVRGLPTRVYENDNTYVTCKKGKQHRIHMDLFGPTFVNSLNKKSYCLVVTEDYSRFTWGFFLATKDETNPILKTIITGLENQLSLIVKSVKSKAFRLLNSRTRIVQETLHVNFLENKTSVTGSGPTCLFDINSLTRTMNYQPVNAGNQTDPSAGFQDKFDAEKAREEVDQQYLLFPVWSSGSTNPQNYDGDVAFDDKEHDFDAKKPKYEVILSPSSSAQSRKQDDKTKKEAKGKSPVESVIGYKDLNDITYSDDEDVVGAEADFNNLESFIPVLVDLPYERRAIGTKWVYRNKKDERGIVVRNKARLVTQGHTQQEGINYEEVFALVARIEAIRLFLAYASFMGFMVYQIDVKSAFLYGTIKEEVYVCQPSRFEDPDHPDKVYKVVKALYGLHQAPRACQDNYVAKILRNFGLTKGKSSSTPIETKKPLLKDPDGGATSILDDKGLFLVDLPHGKRDIEEGNDYEEVFAPVVRIEAIRLFLAYASFMRFMMYQMDVKSAFLYGTIEEEVYDCQPLGFKDTDYPDKIYKVVKALYGLHQAPRACQDKNVAEILRKFSLTDGKSYSTLIDIEKPLLKDPDEGIDCLSNVESFAELSRMGYEKPSTKLTFYKAFFSPQWKVGKGFLRVDTPLFKGMLVAQQADEGATEVNVDDVPTAGVAHKGATNVNHDVVLPTVDEPSIPSPPPTTQLPPSSQNVPSTPQDVKISMDLLHNLLDTCTTLTRRVDNLEQDKIAESLEITMLKQRVKKLERRNKLKVSKLRRLKKVGTTQRVDTSDDIVMDDVSKHGRIIADMDVDVDVTQKDVANIAKEVVVDAKIEESADVQGRQVESQAQIYQIDLEHADKVLRIATITAAAQTLTTALSVARRRKGVVIRDPEETSTPSTIIDTEAKSKDKGKGILVEEPKPLKKQVQIKQDEAFVLALKNNDIYSTVDACSNACEMWNAIERLKHSESINVQDLETNLYWEFGKFTSQDGESLESYYSRIANVAGARETVGSTVVQKSRIQYAADSGPIFDDEPLHKVKERQEKDKIGSKPDKNGKCGEAWKIQSQSQSRKKEK